MSNRLTTYDRSDRGSPKRCPARVWVILVAGAMLPLPSQGQTTFNPSVSAGWTYTDNVDYVGDSGDRGSDSSIGLGFIAPLRRRLRQGSLGLTYNFNATRYDESREFDDTAHRLWLDYEWNTPRGSSWRMRSRYTRTGEQLDSRLLPIEQVPGQPGSGDSGDTDLTINERTDREEFGAELSHGWRLGKRWNMNAGISAGATRVDEGSTLEDRDTYGGSLGMRYTASSRTDLGWRYRYGRSLLDESGDEDLHSLDFVYDYDVTRRLGMELRAGGYVRLPDEGDSESGATGTFRFRFNDGLTMGPVRVGFGGGVSPSSGGNLVGTSLNTSAGVSLSGVRVVPWNWSVRTRYTHREPFDDQATAETDTISVRAEVERRIGRFLGVQISGSRVEQTSDDPVLDGSFVRAGASLVVYPLAGKRIAGG